MAKKKQNKIEVKVIKGNNVSETKKPDMPSYERLVQMGEKVEKSPRPALLVSRLDHPEYIKYGASTIRLSPRAFEKVGDVEKLDAGNLPKGIYLKKLASVKK